MHFDRYYYLVSIWLVSATWYLVPYEVLVPAVVREDRSLDFARTIQQKEGFNKGTQKSTERCAFLYTW